MPTNISRIELTSEDAKTLRKKLIAIVIFFVFASAIFYFGAFYFGDMFHGFETGTYIFIGFAVFFFGIIFYMGFGLVRDLFKGEKLVIRGKVTNKRRHKSSSSSGTRGGGMRGSRSSRGGSSSSPKFYLYFGDQKYYVDHKHYNMAHVGQEIELHYAKHSSSSLQVVQLSETDITESIEETKTISQRWAEKKELIANLPKKEVSMSRKDLLLLKRYRNRMLRVNVFFSLSFGFMAIAFTFGGLFWWVMWIPAGVLWVILFLIVKAIFKVVSKYRREEISNIKLVVMTKITDKQHHTGSFKGYKIITDYGTFNVSQKAYESVHGQDQVFVSVGKYSGWFIEFISKDGREEIL